MGLAKVGNVSLLVPLVKFRGLSIFNQLRLISRFPLSRSDTDSSINAKSIIWYKTFMIMIITFIIDYEFPITICSYIKNI